MNLQRENLNSNSKMNTYFLKRRTVCIIALLHLIFGVNAGYAGCYFPLEFQGEFLTQSLTSREIAYTSVSILFDSIPSWGNCYRRLGRHIILSSNKNNDVQRSRGEHENSSECFKCISIITRSTNVLQLHVNELGRCWSTEEEARASCPNRQDVRERKATEMMFYKTRSFYGGSAITRTYCPLNGNYKFTYSKNDGTEDDLECNSAVSRAGDCPKGYKFDLHFRGCSFPNFDMSFQCLGSWAGDNGETYMSLLDTQLPQLDEDPRPRYRCALFKEDPDTGLTHMAFSSDSTCVNHLYTSQDGYETLHLEKEDDTIETSVSIDGASSYEQERTCIFPEWMNGEWEGLSIDGDHFTYRDEQNFVTYRGKCLEPYDQLASNNAKDAEMGKVGLKYLLKLKTECGEVSYNCALFQRRDSNVMEFQLGISSTDSNTGSDMAEQLCSSENFTPSKWQTLGRMDAQKPPHCPLVGEYTGVIPDAEGLCAKSYTDCNNPEVMFYTVYNCHNETEVYEEREYRCFGQWTEPETGLVYTYTERRDILGHECFVGVDVDNDKSIVTEAGSNCERGHQPRKYGMTLQRQAKCPSNNVYSSLQDSVSLMPKINVNEQVRYIEEKILRDENDNEGDNGDIDIFENRPISPRLSTVHSVVVDGRKSNFDSDQRALEKVLDIIEREEEERYNDHETNFEQSENNKRHNHRKHKKHGHKHKVNSDISSDEDIATNEIPDYYSGSSSASYAVMKINHSWFTQISILLCVLLYTKMTKL